MSSSAETTIIARESAPRRAPTKRRRAAGTHMSVVSDTAAKRSEPKHTRAPSPLSQALPSRTRYFALLILAVLTLGLLGMLAVNTALAQGAFSLTELQQQRAQLVEAEQALRAEVAVAEAPAQVERAARELGMVPQDVPVFLRLADGAILGNPIPQPAPIVEEPAAQDPAAQDPAAQDPAAQEPVVDSEVVEP